VVGARDCGIAYGARVGLEMVLWPLRPDERKSCGAILPGLQNLGSIGWTSRENRNELAKH
jgi:hypothetical protein